MNLPSSQLIREGIQPAQEPAKQPVQPQVQTPRKVTGHSIPDFSFTGEMRVVKHEEVQQQTQTGSSQVSFSDKEVEQLKAGWEAIMKQLEGSGKIRLLAALSHSRFDDGAIVVTVANKAIEQEVLDARGELQDMLYELTKVKAFLKVEVTEDEVFIAKPVSDTQRLQAMIEKYPELKVFCAELKLRL